MIENSYHELAEHLKALPLGFPAAQSGVELKILEKLFSPEEAKVASNMKLEYENAKLIGKRLNSRGGELSELLERMLSKGLVDGRGRPGNREYRFLPFLNIHGDLPVSRIDREYVELFEQYLEEVFAAEMGKAGPPYIRTFPAERSITAKHEMPASERVSEMVAQATHYVISDCACCRKMKLLGRDCRRRVHRCISLYYEDDFGADIRIEYRGGRRSSREEVLNLLRIAEEEGFIHTASNIRNAHTHICNCCPDCCPFHRMIRQDKSPYIIAPSNYLATIDSDLCVACGVCAEERCPVNAIEGNDESYRVKPERCTGCGACVLTCPSGALSLVRKEEEQISLPPADTRQWIFHRALRESLMIEDVSQDD